VGDEWDPDGPKTMRLLRPRPEPDSLEVATYKAAWLDECGQDDFKQDSWHAIRAPSLASRQGRVLLTTTVYNLGWIKKVLYDKWRRGDPEIKVVHFDSDREPAVPARRVGARQGVAPRLEVPDVLSGPLHQACWAIYDCYDEERHEIEPRHPRRLEAVHRAGLRRRQHGRHVLRRGAGYQEADPLPRVPGGRQHRQGARRCHAGGRAEAPPAALLRRLPLRAAVAQRVHAGRPADRPVPDRGRRGRHPARLSGHQEARRPGRVQHPRPLPLRGHQLQPRAGRERTSRPRRSRTKRPSTCSTLPATCSRPSGPASTRRTTSPAR
jgi:hypothetical protein